MAALKRLEMMLVSVLRSYMAGSRFDESYVPQVLLRRCAPPHPAIQRSSIQTIAPMRIANPAIGKARLPLRVLSMVQPQSARASPCGIPCALIHMGMRRKYVRYVQLNNF